MAKIQRVPADATYDSSTGFWRYASGPNAGRAYPMDRGRVPSASAQRRREVAPAIQTPVKKINTYQSDTPSRIPAYRKPITLNALNDAMGFTPKEIKQVEDKKYQVTFDPTQIIGYERQKREEQAAAIAEATAAYRKRIGQLSYRSTIAKRAFAQRASAKGQLKRTKQEILKLQRQIQRERVEKKPRYETMTAEELVKNVPAERMPQGLTAVQKKRYLEVEDIARQVREKQITRIQKRDLETYKAQLEKEQGRFGVTSAKRMARSVARSFQRAAPQTARQMESIGRAMTTGLFAHKAFKVPRAQIVAASRLRRLQASRQLYEMRRRQAMEQQMAQAQAEVPQPQYEQVAQYEQAVEQSPEMPVEEVPQQYQRYANRPVNSGNYGYKPSYDSRDYTSEETQGGFWVPTSKMPQQSQDKGGFFRSGQLGPGSEEPRAESNLLSLDTGNTITPKRRII